MAAKKTPNFEKSIEQLESLVDALESGDLSLEDSLKTFEKGINLTRQCQQALSEAEQKVQILLQNNNGENTEESVVDFDDSDDA
ncbi:Exodeoxyribonuclease 7 small subunit [Thalassocella blandensis]|nr:Exodeoxyribonuclease 7 small subunit [Thalassocella blandensis]